MEHKDPLEEKFRSAFDGFEQEPPPEAWVHLQKALHPVRTPGGILSRILAWFLSGGRTAGFYFGIAGVSLGLFAGIFWFGVMERHAVRGHAYAGGTRLTAGTATLFSVSDRALPWDSLEYCRSDNLDQLGHFSFSSLKQGNYLLRVAPVNESEKSVQFLPTWWERREQSDSAKVIRVVADDLTLDVELVRKRQ